MSPKMLSGSIYTMNAAEEQMKVSGFDKHDEEAPDNFV
jgi:hypothetical protein